MQECAAVLLRKNKMILPDKDCTRRPPLVQLFDIYLLQISSTGSNYFFIPVETLLTAAFHGAAFCGSMTGIILLCSSFFRA